jgi:predicted regulator of Ras-like GTPase activity (Roadblock/LC7/MglB family)
MKEKLEEINSIAGVRASFIYFNDGEVQHAKLPPGLDADALQEIGKDVVQLSAIFERLTTPMQEFDFKFDNGRMMAFAHHNYNLIVLCDPGVSLAMLRLTVNVAMADMEADKKFQKRIQKIESTRRSFLIRSNMDTECWKLVEVVN